VTFGFGLIHGIGFSAILRNIGLPTNELVPALLGFNIGVEIGQLFVVAPLFPLLLWLKNNKEKVYIKTRLVLCIIVASLAIYWFAERAINVWSIYHG
jgi:hypothetical protein